MPALLFTGVFLLLPVVAVLQGILGQVTALILGGLLYLASRLLPKRIRQRVKASSESRLPPFTSVCVFGVAIAVLVGIFCFTTKDPKGVLIFVFMIAIVVGFFAFMHQIDVKWRVRRKLKNTATDHASNAPSEPAPGPESSTRED